MDDKQPPSGSVCNENYRAEYAIVASAWRFFTGLRFIVAAFTVTVQSALFTLYLQLLKPTIGQPPSPRGAVTVICAGIVSVSAVMILEWRTITLLMLAIKRASELEFRLGLSDGYFHRLEEVWTTSLRRTKLFITHAAGFILIYISIAILWIVLLYFALQ